MLKDSFEIYGGPKIFMKYGMKTCSGGPKRYILKAYFELSCRNVVSIYFKS